MQSMMSERWKDGLLHICLLTISFFTKNSHALIDCKGIEDVWTYQDDTAVFSLTLPGKPDTFAMRTDAQNGNRTYEESGGIRLSDMGNPYYRRISRTRSDTSDGTVDYRYNISLSNVNRSDVRAYFFTYSEGGTNYCDMTSLNIYGAPNNINLTPPDDGVLYAGNMTSLTCSATPTSITFEGRSKPLLYLWNINGTLLGEPDTRFTLSANGAVLTINLGYNVIGLSYKCFAQEEGSRLRSDDSTPYSVDFKYPPRFAHNLNDFGITSGILGNNLKWDVELLANPEPDPHTEVACKFKQAMLKLNESPFINAGQTYSLQFTPLDESDLGVYTFSAVTELGMDEFNVEVLVKTSPRKVTDFEIEKTTAASIHITWKPNWDGGETQTIKLTLQEDTVPDTNQVLNLNDSVTNFAFTGLTAVARYTISILSMNDLGNSEEEITTAMTKAKPITDLKRVKYNRKDDDVSISLQLNVDSATHFDITVCVNDKDINCTYLDVPVTTQSMEPRLGLPDPEEELFDINIRFYDGDILVQTVSEERIHLAEGLDRNILIGIIVGVVVGVILIAVVIVITLLILRKKRRQKEPSITKGYIDDNGTKTNGFDNTACNIEGYEDVEFSRAAVRNGAPKNPPPKPPHTLVPTYADVDMKKTNNIPMQQNNYRQPQDTVFPTYADVDMKKTNNIPMQPMVPHHNNNQPQNTGPVYAVVNVDAKTNKKENQATKDQGPVYSMVDVKGKKNKMAKDKGEKADKKKKKTKEKDPVVGAPHTENYNAEESEYYNTKADGPDDQMVKVSEAQQYAPKNPGVVYAELALNDSRPDNARGKRKPDEPVQYADINFNK